MPFTSESARRWGRIGGQRSGPGRRRNLSPERRSEIARLGGEALRPVEASNDRALRLDIERSATEFLPDTTPEYALAARCLIASIFVGPHVRRIARLLRIQRRCIEPIGRRWRDNRVWIGHFVIAPWMAEDIKGDVILFCLDVMVGTGDVEILPDTGNYRLTGVTENA